MAAPVLIDDATVADALAPRDVLAVIARAFTEPPVAPPRLATEICEGAGRRRTLLTMPAIRARGIATVKLVSIRRGDAIALSSHLLVLDRAGGLLAVVEAHSLTALRTAAASVLAARTLGRCGGGTLAVLGAGRQARAQLEAYAAAMPLDRVAVWARRPEAAAALADVAQSLCLDARVAASARDAVAVAAIVTCATGAASPLVLGADVAPGAHVDLVGGFRPDMREADDGLIARAFVVADTAAALEEAGDLVQPIADGVLAADRVRLLADLLAEPRIAPDDEVTLFKSVGHAGEDLVVAELLLERLGIAPHGSDSEETP